MGNKEEKSGYTPSWNQVIDTNSHNSDSEMNEK